MFDRPFMNRKHFGPGFRRGGPFGGGPFGEGGGRKRQRRGDIRYVLLELIEEQPRHGYELIKALEERNAGFYRPSPGMIYPTLQMLEEEGNLTSKEVDGKRIYTITEAGRQLLHLHNVERGPEWHGGHPHGFGGPQPQLAELRHSSMQIMESVMQAARYGSPEQVRDIQALLGKTNQEIHAILAKGSDKGTI